MDNKEKEDKELSEEELAKLQAKTFKLEKEKKELLASLASGNFSTQRSKVAAILNLYPKSRNSDITLSLKYWEMFQPEFYNKNGIKPEHLFKLERMHFIARARAKIQNEYGLFSADEKVKGHRKKNEEKMQDEVLNDAPARKVVNVFADETGKNGKYVIVASVWVLTGRAVHTVSQAITKWKETSVWKSQEIHFTKFGKKDIKPLHEYLKVILANREFLSFKAIAIEKSKTSRKVSDIVEKLHEHMLIRGAEHEVETNRIDLPREIEMTVDEEQSLDRFALSEMSRRISRDFEGSFNGKLKLCDIQSVSSKTSPLVQLADLVAGALNRHINHQGAKNHKDEMAEKIIYDLDLVLSTEGVSGLDCAALFKV